MCGLFGAVGKIAKNKALIRGLACHNIDRGRDSTGFFALKSGEKKRMILRAAQPAYEFIVNEHFNSLFTDDVYAICGHVRQATHGSICSENAHPFRVGNTVGAHNGMVSNVEELKGIVGKKYEVDSQYLIHLIEERESIKDAAGSLNLVYHKDNDSLGADLRIARHSNPMHLAWCSKKNNLIYSSDDDHLKYAMAQIGINWKIEKLEDDSQLALFIQDGLVANTEQLKFECKAGSTTYFQNWKSGD